MPTLRTLLTLLVLFVSVSAATVTAQSIFTVVEASPDSPVITDIYLYNV